MKWLTATMAMLMMTCTAFSQEPVSTIPAVWAWEIQGNNRTIYLLGEMHFLDVDNGAKVDYQLAQKIYDFSDKAWTESLSHLTSPISAKKKNSLRLKSTTWKELQEEVFSAINAVYFKKTVAERQDFYTRVIQELDELNTPRLVATLDLYASIKNTIETKQIAKNRQDGLISYLMKLEKNANKQKLVPMEPPGISETLWANQCDTDENLESVVSGRLKFFNNEYFSKLSGLAKIQKYFVEQQADITTLHKIVSAAPDWPLTEKCDINPRNILWLPYLKEALNSSGSPIVFIVGIGHIGGENGLLALLEKNGYNKVKRVYSIK
jgi:TraB/PrgY/gumN family